jgi:glycosyltransferase involved in cell wall biosynthesis
VLAPVRWAGKRVVGVVAGFQGEPLGYLTVPVDPSGPDLAAARRQARGRFAAEVAEHLAVEGLGEPGGVPPRPTAACPNRLQSGALVSVVVCTRDRSALLADCLRHLQALTHPHLEVLVVDNAPSDESTRKLVEGLAAADPRLRYVREPGPGLSRARNRGLAEARGEYLAYTDDDVAVDAGWIEGLLRGFGRGPDVACVTGLVATAGISGPAEEYFDARAAAWSTRCRPALYGFDGGPDAGPLHPYQPSLFGTGANVAFDRAFLQELGGFDEALGAGARTRGGEDLDVFVRVLRGGRSIAYEPAAVVWHHHRADQTALLHQMYGYGAGLSAFLTKCLLQRGTRGDVLRRLPLGLRRLAEIRSGTDEQLARSAAGGPAARPPAGAVRRERLGLLAGPLLYLRARAEVQRQGRPRNDGR